MNTTSRKVVSTLHQGCQTALVYLWGLSAVAACISGLLLIFSRNPLDTTSLGYSVMTFGVLPYIVLTVALISSDELGASSMRHERAPTIWSWVAVPVFLSVLISSQPYSALPHWVAVGVLATVFGAIDYLYCFLLNQNKPRKTAHRRSPAPVQEGQVENQASDAEPLLFPAVRPKVTFANVSGMADTKERMLEAGREIVSAPKTQDRARNGMLLFGDPGNGKTFFAEALAGELKLPFISVSFADLGSQWVNQTTRYVGQVFDDARAQAPCLLFIDEIDSLLVDRSKVMNSDSETGRTTNALLTLLVNIRDAGVVVVAATNHLDKIDPAARREGRFDFKVEVPAPDTEARLALINKTARGFKGIAFDQDAIEQAVKRWDRFSVARIVTIVDQAGRTAKKDRQGRVDFAAMQTALRLIQGRKGKLPEDTLTLDQMVTRPMQRNALNSIASRMMNIQEIERLGGAVPTGMIFYGPPGTGKTATAKALAKTTGWAFLSMTGAEIKAKPERIDDYVRDALDMRPCIVFIDEADDVLKNREYSSEHGQTITNKLLQAIEGATSMASDVLWVAATNNPDSMDDAALRRFGEKVLFDVLDETELAQLIEAWFARSKAKLARGITAHDVACAVGDEAPANVEKIMQHAANFAVTRALQGGRAKVAEVTLEDVTQGCALFRG